MRDAIAASDNADPILVVIQIYDANKLVMTAKRPLA